MISAGKINRKQKKEMAKEYYDHKIGPNTDWGGDSSTGGLEVKGNRVQEYIKGEIADLHAADTEMAESMADVIATAEADHVRAESDHLASQEWNEHPPYIGDGTNGEKNYWYVWIDHEYVKSSYAKGDDIDWTTMSQEEYERLVDNVKQDLVFSSVGTCEDIVDELV